MSTLWGTILMMVLTTVAIFAVPMLFRSEPDLEMRTIAMEVDKPPHESGPGGDPLSEPAPAPYRGLVEKLLDNIQELFWGMVQAFLVMRYVKKRAA